MGTFFYLPLVGVVFILLPNAHEGRDHLPSDVWCHCGYTQGPKVAARLVGFRWLGLQVCLSARWAVVAGGCGLGFLCLLIFCFVVALPCPGFVASFRLLSSESRGLQKNGNQCSRAFALIAGALAPGLIPLLFSHLKGWWQPCLFT